jgi:hypothetical protein
MPGFVPKIQDAVCGRRIDIAAKMEIRAEAEKIGDLVLSSLNGSGLLPRRRKQQQFPTGAWRWLLRQRPSCPQTCRAGEPSPVKNAL